MELETARHLCGIVSRFFDHIAEASLDWGEELHTDRKDFISLCRTFTFDDNERDGGEEIAQRVANLAKAILKMAE